MAQNEFYRLDLVVGATGDVQVKEKLNSMDRFIEQTRKRGEALNRLQMSPAVRLQDKLSTPLRSIEGKLKSLGRMGVTVAIRARDMTRGVLRGLASPLGLLGMGALAAGPALFATSSAGKAMDFEARMSSIQAQTKASNIEMQKMSSLALEMGAKTKYSALEAAEGIEELLKAGMIPAAVKAGGLEAALNLATAGELNLADAAKAMSNALTAFKKDNMTAAQASNILAGAANASTTNVAGIQQGMSDVAAVAAGVGMSFRDTSAALGVFANNGLQAGVAGGGLKSLLLNLQPATEKAETWLRKVGIITDDGGNKFYTASGKLKTLSQVAEVMKKAYSGMSDKARQFAMEQAFGSYAITAGTILYKEGAKGIDAFTKAMSHVTALDVAKKKMDNAAGAVEQFRGAVETLQISALMPMMPLIKGFALWAAEMTEKYTPAIVEATKTMAEKIGKYFDGMFSDKTFAKMGFGDKIAFVMNQAIDGMRRWVDGPGGAKVQAMFASLAEIAGRAWIGILQKLLTSAFDNFTYKTPEPLPPSPAEFDNFTYKTPEPLPPSPADVIREKTSSIQKNVRVAGKYSMPWIKPSTPIEMGPAPGTLQPQIASGLISLGIGNLMTGGLLGAFGIGAGKLAINAVRSLFRKPPAKATGTPASRVAEISSKAAKGTAVTKMAGEVKAPTATRVKTEQPFRLLEKKVTLAERKAWVPFEEMPELRTPAARAAARMRAGQTPLVGSVAKVSESAGVAAKSLNPLTRIFGAVGKTALRALAPLALFMTALKITQASAAERNKVIGGEAGGWGVSLAASGAAALAFTPTGPIGMAIAGLAAGIGGSLAGTALGEKIGDNFDNIKAIVNDKFAQIKSGATTGAETTRDQVTSVFDSLATSTETSFGRIPGIVSSRLSQTRIIAHDQTAQTVIDMAAQWESVYNAVNTWAASSYSSVARWFGGISGAVGAGISAAASVVELAGNSLMANPTPQPPKILAHARGGIFTQPHVGLFAEAGPEALIPLAPAQRARAWSIWQQTGERLGIRPYALGGFTDVRPAMTAARDRVAVHKIFKQSNLELTREGLTERLIQPIYSPGQSRDNEAGGYTSPLPAGRPTSSTTTIHINMGEAVRTIQVNNQGDMDAAADKAAAIVAKNLRTILSNLA